jgi:hypothetical protein
MKILKTCLLFLFISENERQLGFVLIIDRRSDRWMAVKSIMTYIEVMKESVYFN